MKQLFDFAIEIIGYIFLAGAAWKIYINYQQDNEQGLLKNIMWGFVAVLLIWKGVDVKDVVLAKWDELMKN